MRIKKRLKRDLTGSVASDWWGDEYLFLLSAACHGVPRLQLTGVLLRLKWSEEIEECVLNHEKTAQLSVGHSLDATLLAELARVVAALGASLLFTRVTPFGVCEQADARGARGAGGAAGAAGGGSGGRARGAERAGRAARAAAASPV
mmetsp:Transcript_43632/g.144464  ORF Transcript_43632/g.144464 Transcript_43632/m.144464 type:complete len:147 (+) Transcript_43632:94-534(+)